MIVENKFLQSRNLFRSTKTRLYAEIRSTDGCSFFCLFRGMTMAFRVVLIENEVTIKVKQPSIFLILTIAVVMMKQNIKILNVHYMKKIKVPLKKLVRAKVKII